MGDRNAGFGAYKQQIVKVLRSHGPLTAEELKERCDDTEFHVSQNIGALYRCLRGLKKFHFVQKTGKKYELTPSGRQLATKSGADFDRFISRAIRAQIAAER